MKQFLSFLSSLIAMVPAPIRGLFRLENTEYAWWEHWIFRISIGYLTWTTTPFMFSALDGCPHYDSIPVGSSIGAYWDGITQLSNPAIFDVVRQFYWVAIVMYVLGVGAPLALTYIVVVDTCIGSLFASQGANGHSRQTMALFMLGLAMASWVVPFLKARGGSKNWLHWTRSAQDFVIKWGCQMFAAAYMASAVTKEVNSKGFWWMHSESFILSVVKAQEESQIKGVSISDAAISFAEWMASSPFLSSCMLLGAWLLEFGAPLALLNRRMALIIGVLVWIFHAINGWFMGLAFPLNRALAATVFINIPFWTVFLATKFFRPKAALAERIA